MKSLRPSITAALFALLALLTFSANAGAADWSGKYQGDGGVLNLRASGGGYAGTLSSEGILFQVKGKVKGGTLVGQLFFEGMAVPFRAQLRGNQLAFQLEEDTVMMTRVGAASDAPAPAAGNDRDTGAGGAGTESEFGGGGGSAEWDGAPAAPATAASGQKGDKSLAGKWYGLVQNQVATMKLRVKGSQFSGEIDVATDHYELSGTLNGSQGRGFVTDTQGRSECTISGDGRALNLTFANGFAMNFSRKKIRAPKVASVPSGGQRDPNLVGRWSKSTSHSSSGSGGSNFSMATQTMLTVNGDGTYRHGDTTMAGGGNMGSMSSSSNDADTGQWYSKDRHIYVRGAGETQFTKWARYFIEDGKMMFFFDDGSKELWYRK